MRFMVVETKSKTRHQLIYAVVLLTALATLACSGHETMQAMSEDVLTVGSTEVGSIVGMPVLPERSVIVLKTESTSTADFETSDENADRQTGAPSRNCISTYNSGFTLNDLVDDTQLCTVKKADYTIGVLAIYLTSCIDAAGAEMICNPSTASAITSRVTLYEGDQVDLTIGEDPTLFPADIANLADHAGFRMGGIQIVAAYVGHVFPDMATDPQAAKAIVPYLRGKAYRICTAPAKIVGAETMALRCGNAEAKQGDMLIDLDDDGIFGFLNVDLITPTYAVESSSRPINYTPFSVHNLKDLFIKDKLDFIVTDGIFYPVPDYLALAMPLPEIQEIKVDETRILFVQLFVEGTLRFMDGMRSAWEHQDVCVAAVSKTDCLVDSDPDSPGVYNPYYDLYPRVRPPKTLVQLLEH